MSTNNLESSAALEHELGVLVEVSVVDAAGWWWRAAVGRN